jgi:Protein of unknown function (DUF2442)
MTAEWEPVRYFVDTDTMAIELRPWPGRPGESGEGEDAGPDLVIHYYPGDGEPWLWEIEHASQHPEHIAAALVEMRRRQSESHEKLHTITGFKPLDPRSGTLQVFFDDGWWPVVDLSSLLKQGGVFEPLCDPQRLAEIEVGPQGRSLVWRVGEDVIELGADALWSMAHPSSDVT